MKIAKATERYEAWLGRHLTMVEKDLHFKHEQMRLAAFPFLRATYYRWAQIWKEVCPEAAAAPEALAVGDLHVENFGTWRDIEGRLIWGINDFDEAWTMPYTNDLIRLATSALLAEIACDPKEGDRRDSQGLSGRAGSRRPAVRAGRAPSLRCGRWPRRGCTSLKGSGRRLHALAEVEEEPPAGALKAIRPPDAGGRPALACGDIA